MRFLKQFAIICTLFCLLMPLTLSCLASEPELDIYIDQADYTVRADISTVNVNVLAFLPYGVAEGTFHYDPKLLTLKNVKYNKQALELSFHERKNKKGIIKICCYGKVPMESPETICFVFNADSSYNGTSEFALGEFTLCDDEQNITILRPEAPLVLRFEKNAVAVNSQISSDNSRKTVSKSASKDSSLNSSSKKTSAAVTDADASKSSQREKDIYVFHDNDNSENIIIYLLIGLIAVIIL